MKNLETLYQELLANTELRNQFNEAAKSGREALEALLKEQNVSATIEELQAFLVKKWEERKELKDDDLTAASGGYEAPDVSDVGGDDNGIFIVPVFLFVGANVAVEANAVAAANAVAVVNAAVAANAAANANAAVNANVSINTNVT